KTGQIITSKDVPAIATLFSATDSIGDSFAALKNTLLIELAPTITKIAEQFQSFVANQGPKFTKTIAGFIHHIKQFAIALTAAFGVVAVGKVVSGITAIITGVRALAASFAVLELSLAPLAAVGAAVAALAAGLGYLAVAAYKYAPPEGAALGI